MKNLRLITALVAVIVCLNFVFGANPLKENESNLANLVIEKLNNDVQLTDSQKMILKQKFNAFAGKMNDADKESTEKDKFDARKMASDEYEMVLDSILSSTQKEQLKVKIAERKNTVTNTSK